MLKTCKLQASAHWLQNYLQVKDSQRHFGTVESCNFPPIYAVVLRQSVFLDRTPRLLPKDGAMWRAAAKKKPLLKACCITSSISFRAKNQWTPTGAVHSWHSVLWMCNLLDDTSRIRRKRGNEVTSVPKWVVSTYHSTIPKGNGNQQVVSWAAPIAHQWR